MKLQSQKTMKFDAKELQRLAKRTRPRKELPLRLFIAAGLFTGGLIAVLLRLVLKA